MLETSKDIFWIVLSFSILWISLFTGWAIYYVVMMLRDVQKISSSLRRKLEIIDQILNTIKERVETTANYLPPLLDAVGKLVNHFKEKREEKLEKEAEAEEKVEKKSKRK